MGSAEVRTTPRTQRERSEETTRALVEAARELFARRGYEATLLEDVARSAGVTKGAMYHHFRGKRELFRAVFEREQRHLVRRIAAAHAGERDAWKGFHAGCRAYLEACLDPGVQRILLVDGPSVLGWEDVRAIEERHSMALVRDGLRLAIEAGAISPRPIEPLATMLNGALCEGAMFVVRSEDPQRETRRVLREVRTLLEPLRAG